MSKQYFVNRHGKKSDVDQETEAMLAVEQIPKPQAPVRVRSYKKPTIHMPKIRISRKVLGISVGVVILALLGSLLMVDAVKREYQRQTAVMKSSVQDLVSKTASTETSAKDAIQGLTSQLTTENCKINATFLADIYPFAKQAADECRATAKNHSELVATLGDMFQVVTYLENQNKVLASALSLPSDGMYAEIPGETTTWQEAYDNLATITPPSSAHTAHERLLVSVKKVASSWGELQAAYTSQDAEAFTAFEAKLAKAYEELRTSGDELKAVIVTLQQNVDSRVSALQ